MNIPQKVIARLSLYRRLLGRLDGENTERVYSHQLAGLAGGSAAQVRRDLMVVGYSGNPSRGYEVAALLASIGKLLDPPTTEHVALVGVGNLGRAILAHFSGRCHRLCLTAAFDNDPLKTGRVFHGCRCYPIEQAGVVIRQQNIRTAILAVPAKDAQDVADILLFAGVRGLLNFTPTRLRVGPDVWVEDMDLMIALEKVAFLARFPTATRVEQPS